MIHNSIEIARYFIWKATEENQGIDLLKLIKLVYISHGWHLAIYDNSLLDENPEACKYGPVIPSIYREFKNYKKSKIWDVNLNKDYFNGKIDDEIQSLLEKIWEVYGGKSGIQLSSLTHQENSPWDQTWNRLGGKNVVSTQIPDTLIKDFYKNKLES
jgi:uncharacterized phage-associated protein